MPELYSSPTFAQLLQQFFVERLMQQRNASPRTVAAYRDTMRLLLQFAEQRLHRSPERLALNDLDAPLILAFLDHLEVNRHNSIRSRNLRLAAVRSFLHYAASRVPESLRTIQQVLAIPMKRYERPLSASSPETKYVPCSMHPTPTHGAASAIA